MITNTYSWSLGSTPNKSLESIGPSIPNHPPGGRTTVQKPESFWSKHRRFAGFAPLQIRAIYSHSVAHPTSLCRRVATSLSRSSLTSACPKFGANQTPDLRPADPGDTAADSLSRVLPLSGAVHSHSVAHPRSPRHLVATSLSRTAHSLSFHNPTSLCRHVATSLSSGPDRSDRFLNFDLSQSLFPETQNPKP